jgi:hypothetical protein
VRAGVTDASKRLLRGGQRLDERRDLRQVAGNADKVLFAFDDALGQEAVQADDAALVHASGEAQVRLAIEARRALTAATPDGRHHYVADADRAHAAANALDTANRLVADDQVVIAVR